MWGKTRGGLGVRVREGQSKRRARRGGGKQESRGPRIEEVYKAFD